MAIYFGCANEDREHLYFLCDGYDSANHYHYCDVVRCSTGLRIVSDQALIGVGGYSGLLHRGDIDLSAAGFVPGNDYVLVVKDISGTTPTYSEMKGFHIDYELGNRTDLILDRQTYIRNLIENVLFPRTKRLLALEGENFVMDLVGTDNSGNMTSFRMRIFDTKTNAENATKDLETAALPEPGEVLDYTVTQTYDNRGVKDLHISVLDTSAADLSVNENTASTQVFAPGNESGWPE